MTTITDITRVLVRAKTEREVFLAACEAATRHDYYELAWVGLPRQDAARSVVVGANAGRAKGFIKDLEISWGDVPLGRGPTGTAIRAEKLFSDSMMESTPGIVYFYDRDGRFLRWNHNFALISGYSDAEIARCTRSTSSIARIKTS